MNRQETLDLWDERDQWEAACRWWYQFGVSIATAHDHGAGRDCAAAIRDAYAAGLRAAHPNRRGFDAGWAACWDRFADLIGGRLHPIRPTQLELKRWTRHAPRCRHRMGGTQSCQRAGCIPGGREDFGKPAPWDKQPARAGAAQ